MATLSERKNYREAVLKALYEATEGNRLLGISGTKLRSELQILQQDLPPPALIWQARDSSRSTGSRETHPRWSR
jgi:hypothetical protein